MTKRFTAVKVLVCITASVFFAISPVIAPAIASTVHALNLEEQLAQVERDLANIRKQKTDLGTKIDSEKNKLGQYQGELGKLQSETESLQLNIAELDLQNNEVSINIQMVEDLISKKKDEMSQNEGNMVVLETATDQQISTNYMDYRSQRQNRTDFFTVKDANTYFKDSQYREIIQDQTDRVLNELENLKIQLEKDKADLEEKAVTVLRQKAILDEQKSELTKAQADLKSKMDSYYAAIYTSQKSINSAKNSIGAMSNDQARKEAQREQIRQQLFNSFNSIPAGQYVLAGTQIGNQGATGWATGPHLHFAVKNNGVTQNPCNYLPGGIVAGCGASGPLLWPLHGVFYYTSAYYSGVGGDLRCLTGEVCQSHPAIDIAHSIWNAPVYAAHDGWLFKGVDQYGALYIIICQNRTNCNSGFQTGYWHLSSY